MAALCGDVLGSRLVPAALGFITLFFGLGQACGPSVAGALADRSGSFASAFLVAAVASLAGAVGAAFLGPQTSAKPPFAAVVASPPVSAPTDPFAAPPDPRGLRLP